MYDVSGNVKKNMAHMYNSFLEHANESGKFYAKLARFLTDVIYKH